MYHKCFNFYDNINSLDDLKVSDKKEEKYTFDVSSISGTIIITTIIITHELKQHFAFAK